MPAFARAGVPTALPRAELDRLRLALRQILTHAIRLGGSSVSDYVDADGERGFFQLEHCVYLRTGEPCRRCQTPIRRIVVAGRGTHLLPQVPALIDAGEALCEQAQLSRHLYAFLKNFRLLTSRIQTIGCQTPRITNCKQTDVVNGTLDCSVISASDVTAAQVTHRAGLISTGYPAEQPPNERPSKREEASREA